MASDSRISRHALIGPGVELGERVTIGPNAVVLGPCVIEDDVWIGTGAHIGAPPEISTLEQNAAWTGDLQHAGVRIATGAVIREGAIIHQGSHRSTTVGAGSWVLNRAYLAHDVILGEQVTVSAGVSIGGHCIVGDCTNIGLNAAVHQRRFIGSGCMIGMNTPVTRDLPPFVKAYGSPVRIHGVNTVVLERQGARPDEIEALVDAYASGDSLLKGIDPAWWSPALAEGIRSWHEQADRIPAHLA